VKKEKHKAEQDALYEAITSYVRVRGSVDSIDLIEKFGEEPVNDLIRLGELTEENGIIRILE
jgi:hypothetical protein